MYAGVGSGTIKRHERGPSIAIAQSNDRFPVSPDILRKSIAFPSSYVAVAAAD
jgi:hypothetical protein